MLITYKSSRVMVPDFLIVGAARAGTTSLYYALKAHPDCFLPGIKEPRFFSYRNNPPLFVNPATGQLVKTIITDLDDYVKLFQNAGDGQLLGEASTSYLYISETTIRNIREIYASNADRIKFITILRNPIERAWSQYHMHVRDKVEPLSFKEAISDSVIQKRLQERWPVGYDYIGFGMYSKQLRNFLGAFPNIKVLLYDELKHDSERTLDDILQFLGVDNTLRRERIVKYNVSGVPKNSLAKLAAKFIYQPNRAKQIMKKFIPKSLRYQLRVEAGAFLFNVHEIPPKIYVRLSGIFEDDIRETGKLIGRNLDHWIKR